MSHLSQNELYNIVGQNIRACRSKLSMSQTDLASIINLSRTSVVNIEQGRQHPSLYLLSQIATALKVGVHDLIPNNGASHSKSEELNSQLLKAIVKTGISESSQEKLRNFTDRIINSGHES